MLSQSIVAPIDIRGVDQILETDASAVDHIRNYGRMEGDMDFWKQRMAELINNLRADGFLFANVDSLYLLGGDNYTSVIHTGKQFDSQNITWILEAGASAHSPALEKNVGIQSEARKYVLDQKEGLTVREFLEFAQNHGYPFASVSLENPVLDGDTFSAIANLDPGPFISFDSIVLQGVRHLKRTFIEPYLGIEMGNPFNQSAIDQINVRMASLDFVEMSRPAGVSFQNEEARVVLNLKERKANRLDAFVGLFPNSGSDGDQFVVTGAIDLQLKNLFRSGKTLLLQWDRIKPQTQSLKIRYDHPFLFSSKISIGSSLTLYRQDSSFLDRELKLQLGYPLTDDYNIGLFSNSVSSSLVNAGRYQGASQLPEFADFSVNGGGIWIHGLPTEGILPWGSRAWAINAEVSVGQKTIRKNALVADALYSDIKLKSLKTQARLQAEALIMLSASLGVTMGAQGGVMANDELFVNDLFRLGGLHGLRGFNENTFFASRFGISSFELKLFYGQRSSVFLLYDQSWLRGIEGSLQNGSFTGDVDMTLRWETPFGIGFGIDHAGSSGVFSLVFALGKSRSQPFRMSYSRIHFGYQALF